MNNENYRMNKSSDKKEKWYRRNKLKQGQDSSNDKFQENLEDEVRRVVAEDNLMRQTLGSLESIKPKRVFNELSSEDYFPTAKRETTAYSSKFDFSDDLDMSSGAFPTIGESPKPRRVSLDEERQMTFDFSNTAMLNLSSKLEERLFQEDLEDQVSGVEDEDYRSYNHEIIDRDKLAFFEDFTNYQQEQKRAYDEAQRNFNETQRINLEDDFTNLARNASYHSQTERLDFAPWTMEDFTFLNDYSDENKDEDNFDNSLDEQTGSTSSGDFTYSQEASQESYAMASKQDNQDEESKQDKLYQVNGKVSNNDVSDLVDVPFSVEKEAQNSYQESICDQNYYHKMSSAVNFENANRQDLGDEDSHIKRLENGNIRKEDEVKDSDKVTEWDFNVAKKSASAENNIINVAEVNETIAELPIRKVAVDNNFVDNQVRAIELPIDSSQPLADLEESHNEINTPKERENVVIDKDTSTVNYGEVVGKEDDLASSSELAQIEEHFDIDDKQYVDSYGARYQDPFLQDFDSAFQREQDSENLHLEEKKLDKELDYVKENLAPANETDNEYVDLSIFSEEELDALGLNKDDKIKIDQFDSLYYEIFKNAQEETRLSDELDFTADETNEAEEVNLVNVDDLSDVNVKNNRDRENLQASDKDAKPNSFFKRLFSRKIKNDQPYYENSEGTEDEESQLTLNLHSYSDSQEERVIETKGDFNIDTPDEINKTDIEPEYQDDVRYGKGSETNINTNDKKSKILNEEILGNEELLANEEMLDREDKEEAKQENLSELENDSKIIKKINLKDHIRRINNWFRGEVDYNDSLTAKPDRASRAVKLNIEDLKNLNEENKEKLNKSTPTPIIKNRNQQSERLRQRDFVSNNFANKRSRASRPLDILELPESPVILLSEAEKELNPSRMIIPAKIDIFKESPTKSQVLYEILDWIKVLLIALVVGLFVVNFVVQRNEVNGRSMVPTLQNGDQLIVQKVSRYFSLPKYGEIITFVHPDKERTKDNHLVKRVIGLPGDRIEIRNEKVYRNGIELDEPYLAAGTVTARAERGYDDIVLEDNQIFVLGDNRSVSADSRIFGPINKDTVEGQILFRIYPFNSLGIPK